MTEPERQATVPWLTRYLADCDTPCPACGYNLRGLTGERCPECGEHLVITIGLAEPKLASFLAAAIALGAGIGFNSLILGYLLLREFAGLMDMYPLLVSLGVEGGALAALLRFRRWFRTRPASVRWLGVFAASAATVASAAWFFDVIE